MAPRRSDVRARTATSRQSKRKYNISSVSILARLNYVHTLLTLFLFLRVPFHSKNLNLGFDQPMPSFAIPSRSYKWKKLRTHNIPPPAVNIHNRTFLFYLSMGYHVNAETEQQFIPFSARLFYLIVFFFPLFYISMINTVGGLCKYLTQRLSEAQTRVYNLG